MNSEIKKKNVNYIILRYQWCDPADNVIQIVWIQILLNKLIFYFVFFDTSLHVRPRLFGPALIEDSVGQFDCCFCWYYIFSMCDTIFDPIGFWFTISHQWCTRCVKYDDDIVSAAAAAAVMAAFLQSIHVWLFGLVISHESLYRTLRVQCVYRRLT